MATPIGKGNLRKLLHAALHVSRCARFVAGAEKMPMCVCVFDDDLAARCGKSANARHLLVVGSIAVWCCVVLLCFTCTQPGVSGNVRTKYSRFQWVFVFVICAFLRGNINAKVNACCAVLCTLVRNTFVQAGWV